jgi:signal transduction histidine kinase
VLIDPLRLRQLVLNLTLNAIQAVQRSPGAIAEVHLILEPTALRVADSGSGVALAVIPQLFEAFTTSRPEGTGLGLHLAKCIADAHGADLVYTPGNPGACFTLSGLRPA